MSFPERASSPASPRTPSPPPPGAGVAHNFSPVRRRGSTSSAFSDPLTPMGSPARGAVPSGEPTPQASPARRGLKGSPGRKVTSIVVPQHGSLSAAPSAGALALAAASRIPFKVVHEEVESDQGAGAAAAMVTTAAATADHFALVFNEYRRIWTDGDKEDLALWQSMQHDVARLILETAHEQHEDMLLDSQVFGDFIDASIVEITEGQKASNLATLATIRRFLSLKTFGEAKDFFEKTTMKLDDKARYGKQNTREVLKSFIEDNIKFYGPDHRIGREALKTFVMILTAQEEFYESLGRGGEGAVVRIDSAFKLPRRDTPESGSSQADSPVRFEGEEGKAEPAAAAAAPNPFAFGPPPELQGAASAELLRSRPASAKPDIEYGARQSSGIAMKTLLRRDFSPDDQEVVDIQSSAVLSTTCVRRASITPTRRGSMSALMPLGDATVSNLMNDCATLGGRAMLVLQMAEALSVLAEEGYVHRDLKAANAVLKEGKVYFVDPSRLGKVGTESGMQPGTAVVSSPPETIPDIKNYHPDQKLILMPSLDVWSLGMELYNAVYRSYPHLASDDFARMNTILKTDYIATIFPEYPLISTTGQFYDMLISLAKKEDGQEGAEDELELLYQGFDRLVKMSVDRGSDPKTRYQPGDYEKVRDHILQCLAYYKSAEALEDARTFVEESGAAILDPDDRSFIQHFKNLLSMLFVSATSNIGQTIVTVERQLKNLLVDFEVGAAGNKFKELIKAAIARDPEQRITASEFVRRLDTLLFESPELFEEAE